MTWYQSDSFTDPGALPGPLTDDDTLHGPTGPALVSVFAEGRTTSGWGLAPTPARGDSPARPGFMEDYAAHRFRGRARLVKFERHGDPFALVVRASNLLVVDIDQHMDDGGADGYLGVLTLPGELPPTVAETSKSGGGRHLFYRTPDTWEPTAGFGMFDDVIGLAPGVDVRAVGCVYHYPTQRWNDRPLADAPFWLLGMLDRKKATKVARKTAIATAAADPDDVEALIMFDTLVQELNKDIKAGKRNNTLFAIGSQMKVAAMPDWEQEIERRGTEIGLDLTEIEKIISNIERYEA